MTRLDTIERGPDIRPRRILIYGTHGIGKTTFAAMAESPVFIRTEDGLGALEVDRFPLCTSWGDVLACLDSLIAGKHDYRTVVIDSLDWLERLILAETCRRRQVESIEEIPYGKGYVHALVHWREVLSRLDRLRHERGMQSILIAHAGIERFQNPETESYDRYVPRLQKHASFLVQEWADEVLFAAWRVHTKSTLERFDRRRIQGIGTGMRVLRTTERPSHVAKNRLGLPEEIALDYAVFAALVRGDHALLEAGEPQGALD
jgi:hypothetical protein